MSCWRNIKNLPLIYKMCYNDNLADQTIAGTIVREESPGYIGQCAS